MHSLCCFIPVYGLLQRPDDQCGLHSGPNYHHFGSGKLSVKYVMAKVD